jgi:hypothetical protein
MRFAAMKRRTNCFGYKVGCVLLARSIISGEQPMKKLLQQWFNRINQPQSAAPQQRDIDVAKHIELLIPISQLYGIEFHPSVYRYYER